MEQKKVWDIFVGDDVEMPAEMEAFLDDIVAVCRKHRLSIAHEDIQGGFVIEPLKGENIAWITNAAKRYTREVDPATGKPLVPANMGRNCPARGKSCSACQFKDYCFRPYDRRAVACLQNLLNTKKEE